MAMYPMLKQASERLKKEGDKLEGTPLATTTTFEAVKSKAQMAEAAEAEQASGGGGLGGMLARKMARRTARRSRAPRSSRHHEFQEVGDERSTPADIDLPAGFKEKK